jgi:serralysin
VVEKAIGGAAADTIIGNEARNWLAGGGGQDKLTGGASSDTFIFLSLSDSAAGSKRDLITDFAPSVDIIDLSLVDISNAPGVQHFHHVEGGFGGTLGELRFTSGLLSGDVNGDRKADFEIALANVKALDWSHDVLLA